MRHERFIEAFAVHLDLAEAAHAEGITVEAARALVVEDEEVSREIDVVLRNRAVKEERRAERIIRELAVIGFSSLDHYDFPSSGGVEAKAGAPDGALRAIKSLKVTRRELLDGVDEVRTEVQFWDKLGALDQMAKHLNLYKSAEESGGEGVTKVVIELQGQGVQERAVRQVPGVEVVRDE